MDDDIQLLRHIYACFNKRDIDGALASLADDVIWANGMDGGHVQGRDAVRSYWTRQWSMVSPHVEPVTFRRAGEGTVIVEVRQTVRDLDGRPLQDRTHGLTDRTVVHVFAVGAGEVARFDIDNAS